MARDIDTRMSVFARVDHWPAKCVQNNGKIYLPDSGI